MLAYLSLLLVGQIASEQAAAAGKFEEVHPKLVINEAEQGGLPDPKFGDLFMRREILFSGGQYSEKAIPYLLKVPQHLEPGKKYPLVIWFHGHGPVEFSHEKLGSLNWLDRLFKDERGTVRDDFFILAPRCFDERPWFVDSGDTVSRFPDGKGSETLTMAKEMVEQAVRQNDAIDRNRISATGLSSGGTASWEFAMRNPGLLAAIAPISSVGGDESRLRNLKGTAIWAFHNAHDSKAPVEKVRRTVDACNQLGVSASLTEFDKGGHNAWTSAFRERNLREWLLVQQRGQISFLGSLMFELKCLNWSYIAKFAGVSTALLVTCMAVRQEVEKRKRQSRQTRAQQDQALAD